MEDLLLTLTKISNSQGGNNTLNIKPYFNDDCIQTGYRVRRREHDKVYQKIFSDTKYTIEENLARAKEWIQMVKENNMVNNKYNKVIDLPTNINYITKNTTNHQLSDIVLIL